MTTLGKVVARSALAVVVVLACGCAATNGRDDAGARSDAADKALEECLKKMGQSGKVGWGDVLCVMFSPNPAAPGCSSPDATDMGQCPADSAYCKANPDAPQCGGGSSTASSGQGGGDTGSTSSDPSAGGSGPGPGAGGDSAGSGGDGTGGSASASCGDGVCDSGEDSNSCPDDCGGGGVCGDGSCDAGEDEFSCPDDCGGGGYCGDGSCDGGEDADTCPDDCA